MSFTGRFCLRCGKRESDEEPLIDGLCLDCFLKERALAKIPNNVVLVRCPVCGSVYVSGSWVPTSGGDEEALSHYIVETVVKKGKTHESFKDVQVVVTNAGNNRAEVLVRSSFMSKPVEQAFTINYRVEARLCPRCLSVKTRDYEAILQVRFAGEPSEVVRRRVGKLISSVRSISSNVTDYKELREGVDVKFSNVSAARQAANYLQGVLGGYIKESWKLHGVVGGKRHGKLSIVLRIPQLIPGELIVYRNSLMEVLDIQRDKLVLRDLTKDEVVKTSFKSLTKEGFRQLSPEDYAVDECEVIKFEEGRLTASCVSGAVVEASFPKHLSVGERIQVITYKDLKYVKRLRG
ncbi:MAG: hypothetical protein LM561_06720 [Desulfurococcaceae archaeon]|nr:hypothetical protein [Desulfurococcaceae archaeon]